MAVASSHKLVGSIFGWERSDSHLSTDAHQEESRSACLLFLAQSYIPQKRSGGAAPTALAHSDSLNVTCASHVGTPHCATGANRGNSVKKAQGWEPRFPFALMLHPSFCFQKRWRTLHMLIPKRRYGSTIIFSDSHQLFV